MSAGQDGTLRLFDGASLKRKKSIPARDIGWSVIDSDFSRNGVWLAYSSWAPFVWIANTVTGEQEKFEIGAGSGELDRVCLFSIGFSEDSLKLLCGSSDQHAYVYDIPSRTRETKVLVHADDVNAVRWLDEGSTCFLTGSDDCLVKLWDTRALARGQPVTVFAGHMGGVTCVDSMRDGIHLLSQAKDQSIRLWDLRVGGEPNAVRQIRANFDYRWERANARARRPDGLDHSVMVYQGHMVARTLIRAYFSPAATTGQRYIVSGSACGRVFVYDVLTGEVVKVLQGHQSIVRDVAWHPKRCQIVSGGWDSNLVRWEL
jgi:WD repeat-containing protein 23